MKKLIAKVFGVEMYANAQNIHGKKSSGVEDSSSYRYWRNPGEFGIIDTFRGKYDEAIN